MKRILCAILCTSIVFVFASCSDNGSSSDVKSTTDDTTQINQTTSALENIPQSDGDYDLSFSNRDCDSSYDENSCKITFTDASVQSDSENGVAVNGTDVTITKEGTYILSGECSDGDVEPGAFNSDSGKSLTINGGYVLVDASGDGLDSNGSLTITGGTILVSGPENSGNGALDYNTSASITGGTLIAFGGSGISQSITGDGQCTIMTDISSQSGDTMFALCDSNSNVIASFNPAKQYSNIVVSSPSIKTGESYKIICGGVIDGADENGFADSGTLTSGTEITEITMSEENYSSGGSMQGGGMRGGPGGMPPR